MVRISKQGERRSKFPRKRQTKTSNSKCCAEAKSPAHAYKEHENALSGDFAARAFIPKIK